MINLKNFQWIIPNWRGQERSKRSYHTFTKPFDAAIKAHVTKDTATGRKITESDVLENAIRNLDTRLRDSIVAEIDTNLKRSKKDGDRL